MTSSITTTARLLAFEQRRAIPIRATSTLSLDPPRVFGLTPICVAAEQRVTALAFGYLDSEPQVTVIWNPLSRESNYLEPVARALDTYLTDCITRGVLPRVYLSYRAALAALEILGERYRSNTNASEELRRLGLQCSLLAAEAAFAGQQVVAVLGDVLAAHVVTGQSPTEDQHLGALLPWVLPRTGIDPAVDAANRALEPASSLLVRDDDNEIERLRRIAKRGPRRITQSAQQLIELILERSARREWALLLEAHAAFWSIGLPQRPSNEQLARMSMTRFSVAFNSMRLSGPFPDALSRLLDDYEYAAELVEYLDIADDAVSRELARQAGRVFDAQILEVRQPRRNVAPCTVVMRTRQQTLRLRQGTRLRMLDTVTTVSGYVSNVDEDAEAGWTVIYLELIKGVKDQQRPRSGRLYQWVVGDAFNGGGMKLRAYTTMRRVSSPLVYNTRLPLPSPNTMLTGDLTRLADQLRRRTP